MGRWNCGPWLPLVLLLLLLSSDGNRAAAAQDSSCNPKIRFFPKGAEDRNVPHAWGKTAQMSAGNYRDDTLFNVVLTSTNNLPGIVAEAVPMLHIQPVHPLLIVGSTDLPQSCTGLVPEQPDTAAMAASRALGVTAGRATAARPGAAATGQARGAHALDVAESAQAAGLAEPPAQQQQQRHPAWMRLPTFGKLFGRAAPPTAAAQGHSNMPVAAADANTTSAAGTRPPAAPALLTGNGTAVGSAAGSLGPQSVNSGHLLNSSNSSGDALPSGSTALMPRAGRQLLAGEAVTLPAMYRLQYSFNGSDVVDTGAVSMLTSMHRITLSGLKSFPDGYYCLNIKLTIVKESGRMAGFIPVPPADLHTTSQVCFYKLDGLPSGKVAFSSCSENLGVTFSHLKPHPIPLHPGSTKSLFYTVFQLQASLNRTKDWVWPPEATPKSLSHFLALTSAMQAGTTYSWVPEEKVADGWYNLGMEASITSDYSSLLALNSMRAGKYDSLLAPPELNERPKYLATPQYRNGTTVGVQYVQTDFQQMTGPEDELRLAVGDEMQLNWEFEGFGDMFCYIDGRLFNNMGDFNCRSPVQVRIPDKLNHTFRVALQDVCNQTFIVDAAYGTWGFKVLKAPPPRVKTDSVPYVNVGDKFEIGTPASATLRAPKAAAAKATFNAASRRGPLPFWLLTCSSLAILAVLL